MSTLKLLAEFTLDAFLLANAAGAPVDGRPWERDVGGLLVRSGIDLRQSAGHTKLFSMRSASGARHEIDAAGAGRTQLIALEAKGNGAGVTKSEVCHFHVKTFDFYCADVQKFPRRWWRVLVSATPVKRSARALCAHLGIQLCDPAVLPLPMLLWTAARPSADLHFSETLLQEAVRLFEPAVKGLDQLWRFNSPMGQIEFTIDGQSSARIDDLLFIQDELSATVLDFYDRTDPLRLPRRSASLLRSMTAVA